MSIGEFHSQTQETIAHAEGTTEGSTNLIGRIVARVFGFPTKAEKMPVTVTRTIDENGQLWVREFGSQKFQSFLSVYEKTDAHHLIERFGPFSFQMAIVIRDDRLFYVPRTWKFWGLPMPKFLIPAGSSHGFERDGKFHFDVTIQIPIIGKIARYHGWLC